MSPSEYCDWLRGYLDALKPDGWLDKHQFKRVNEMLQAVENHGKNFSLLPFTDRSTIGGSDHVCGMHCDGQDRGGGCDVQDRWLKEQAKHPEAISCIDCGNIHTMDGKRCTIRRTYSRFSDE